LKSLFWSHAVLHANTIGSTTCTTRLRPKLSFRLFFLSYSWNHLSLNLHSLLPFVLGDVLFCTFSISLLYPFLFWTFLDFFFSPLYPFLFQRFPYFFVLRSSPFLCFNFGCMLVSDWSCMDGALVCFLKPFWRSNPNPTFTFLNFKFVWLSECFTAITKKIRRCQSKISPRINFVANFIFKDVWISANIFVTLQIFKWDFEKNILFN